MVPGALATIDLSDNCSDPDGDLDLATLVVRTRRRHRPCEFSYLAGEPGTIELHFTVADATGLVSNEATVTIVALDAPPPRPPTTPPTTPPTVPDRRPHPGVRVGPLRRQLPQQRDAGPERDGLRRHRHHDLAGGRRLDRRAPGTRPGR